MNDWQIFLSVLGGVTTMVVFFRLAYLKVVKPVWRWFKTWDTIFNEFIPDADGSMKKQVTTIQTQLTAVEGKVCGLTSILFSQFRLGNIAMIQCNGGGRCIEINKSWWMLTGLTKNESEGWGFLDAIHPDEKERITKDWASAVVANTEFNFKAKFINKMNDNIFDVEAIFVIDRNSNKEVVSIIGAFIKDIHLKVDKLIT